MCFFTSENNPRTSWSNPRSESRKSDSTGLKKTVCWLEDHNRLQKDALQAPNCLLLMPLVFFQKYFKHILKMYRKTNPIYYIMLPFFDSLSITAKLGHLFFFHFSLAFISQEYECDPVYGNSPSNLAFNSKIFVIKFSILSP